MSFTKIHLVKRLVAAIVISSLATGAHAQFGMSPGTIQIDSLQISDKSKPQKRSTESSPDSGKGNRFVGGVFITMGLGVCIMASLKNASSPQECEPGPSGFTACYPDESAAEEQKNESNVIAIIGLTIIGLGTLIAFE